MSEAETKLAKYLDDTGKVLERLSLSEALGVSREKVSEVLGLARSYFRDAQHFQRSGEHLVGLVAVVYCSGLLDVLRALGLVSYRWRPEVEQ